MIKAEHSEVN